MDLNNSHENEDVLPGELLEDCWFFGNLLHTKSKSRMLRSFSDPCSSSNFPRNSYEDTYESIKKLATATTTTTTTKESRSNRKTSLKKNNLVRAPSLPTSLESEDFHDEEIEFSMGKLIRQASLNYSDTRPPRNNAASSKSFTANSSSSWTQQKSRRKSETAAAEEQRPNQLKTQKSLKDLEIEELQAGFKDLGLDLEEKDLSLSPYNVVSMENKYECARPYLSAAPPVPRWGGKRSTEDMKEQIKFWARAVASNVRQEC